MEEEITNYPEFNTNDFTVVFLPPLKFLILPLDKDGLVDLSYLAFDCFHFSQKLNAISK